MPKKIRELKKLLIQAGFEQIPKRGTLDNNLNGSMTRNGFVSQRKPYHVDASSLQTDIKHTGLDCESGKPFLESPERYGCNR